MIQGSNEHIRDLEQRLAEAEATIAALLSGQIDAVVDPESSTPVLLSAAQSALRASEEALRESEERMRFALESANVGIWDFDFATGVVRWSDILQTQHRVAPGCFGGTIEAFLACVHAEDRNAVIETIRHSTAKGGDFVIQYRPVTTDGSVRWMTGAGRIILDSSGQPLRGVGISQDDTERRRLESVSRQSQKMEAVGRLASGVAHDFNNMLSVILGWTGMAMAEVTPESPVREALDEVMKAGERAATLTKQLLLFSRKQMVESTFFDVNDLVVSMEKLLLPLIGEHLTLVTRKSALPVPVKMDRGQLEQVLMNLVVNSRDAMLDGGTITIATSSINADAAFVRNHSGLTPGEYVVLAISDTGVGMTDEVKAQIFEPFFTTKEGDNGTGLGLATCYGIVTQAGGSIEVVSVVGVGTTIKAYLPLRRDTGIRISSEAISRGYGVETVLLVEDEPAVLRVTVRMLKSLGYSVLSATSGAEALHLIELHDGPLPLLVTDVVLAGKMSGRVLAENVAKLRPKMKIIFASGYTNDVSLLNGISDEGVALLPKPFTAESLGRKVREVLDG